MVTWVDNDTANVAGPTDYWSVTEGDAIASADEITIAAGAHSVTGSTTINTISGGVRDGQMVILRAEVGSTWRLGSSGNIHAADGVRPVNRFSVLWYRDSHWNEQTVTADGLIFTAHDISFTPYGDVGSTNAQDAMQEIIDDRVISFKTRKGAVIPAAGDYTAADITNVPAGAVAAITVQAAITELDTEKQAVSAKDAANGYAGLDASTRVVAAEHPLMPYCKAYRNAAYTTGWTLTAVGLDAEEAGADTLTMHSTSTNNSRITIPAGYAAGTLVLISAQVFVASNAGTVSKIAIKKNGTTLIAQRHTVPCSNAGVGGTDGDFLTISVMNQCAATDYFEMFVANDTTAAAGVGSANTTFMQVVILQPAT